jgi:trehalose 6-phosphate phosphatase
VLSPRTEPGRAGLAALRADPAGALLALDYDGTLAPIVPDPTMAVPAAGAVQALAALADRVGRIAVITGRPAAVAVGLGGLAVIPGLVVMGQYGVERWQDGVVESPEPAPGIAVARAELPAMVARVGAVLEDKGHSLVVHGRTAPRGALERLSGPVGALGERTGLEVHPGRLVLELRPPGFDKHGALLAVADEPRPSVVLFAGDDRGDVRGFDAIDELRAAGVPGVTVFSDSAEGPDELRERADLVVDGPAGVVELLRQLLP